MRINLKPRETKASALQFYANMSRREELTDNSQYHEKPIKHAKFKEMGDGGSQQAINNYLAMLQARYNIFYSNVDMSGTKTEEGQMRQASPHKKNGFPDNVLTIRGKSVYVEVKSSSGKQSDAQKQIEQEILRAGGVYILCRTATFLDNILQTIL